MNEQQIENAVIYAHDCGFDEGYEAAQQENLCEMYVLNDGAYQCGNCGNMSMTIGNYCANCGAQVESVVDEGEQC